LVDDLLGHELLEIHQVPLSPVIDGFLQTLVRGNGSKVGLAHILHDVVHNKELSGHWSQFFENSLHLERVFDQECRQPSVLPDNIQSFGYSGIANRIVSHDSVGGNLESLWVLEEFAVQNASGANELDSFLRFRNHKRLSSISLFRWDSELVK